MHRSASLLANRRRPLAGKGLSHQVSEDLLVRIGAGEFRPGEKLPGEVELMDEYGVGRNTVREAIRGLVALRVVDVRPRRGTTVLAVAPDLRLPIEVASALVSEKMTDDLYEMRMLLETEAAGRAAGRRDPAELRQIRYYHDLYQKTALAGTLPWAIDLKFHAAIAQASGNSVLPLMLEGAHDLLKRERFANSLIVPESVAQVYQEHGAILGAIEAGRRRDARKLMSDHLTRVADSLRRRRDEERDAAGLVPTGGDPALAPSGAVRA